MSAPKGGSRPQPAITRRDFTDPDRASRLLEEPAVQESGSTREELLADLSTVPDPDGALLGLLRLLEAVPASERAGLRDALADPDGRRRLLGVLGSSSALTDHLIAHPEQWRDAAHAGAMTAQERTEQLLAEVDDPGELTADDALRVGYRRQLLAIAARDVTSAGPVDAVADVAAELADLAAAALEAGLAIAQHEVGEAAQQVRLAVIGMGKAGGHELNYVSDVDVILVAEPADGIEEDVALEIGTRLTTRLIQACGASTTHGTLWPVDTALRPEGKQGPLVRTVASHRTYYERWAKTWEFQALLKARHLAGDAALGQDYLDAVMPFVWEAASREDFVEEVQGMRRRVEEHIPAEEVDRQLKLGPGGLRDIEFSVQLLQLVHGRTDETLRSGTTLDALQALAAGGYVAADDAAYLADSYRVLRTLEHRIQLAKMRRTHLMPVTDPALRQLGRALHLFADPVGEVTRLRTTRARQVRRLHEDIFYRPLLTAVARLSPDEARLTPDAARARLSALGYRDPAGALRHLEALSGGVNRAAAIQRQLLPVMLAWFAEQADPDGGLLAFRRVSEHLGLAPWYLRLLRDGGQAAQLLAHTLGGSRLAAELLISSPEAVAMLAEAHGLEPRGREDLLRRMRSAAGRRAEAADAVAAVRAIRRAEIFRIAAADLGGRLDLEQVGSALTDLADATVEAALEVAVAAVERQRGTPLPTDLLVVGMGRFGGQELGYSSDADVLYVHEPHAGADDREAQEAAEAVVTELRRHLATPGSDPPLGLDADLRPEGKAGPMVRSLASYAAYYERWAETWEAQALLRARPVAGHPALGERFAALIDPLRWPEGGLGETQVREIRRLKARMEGERLPRGADRRTHFKLGVGGLTDVEWTIQLLQLQHGHDHPGLRTPQTLPALAAAVEAGLMSEADADPLRQAWSSASRLRNAGMLSRGRPVDSVPSNLRDADAMGRLVDLPPRSGLALADSYRRTARQARAVVDRLFYGEE